MYKNICHFVPYYKDYNAIHTINFVLETKPQPYSSLKTQSVYKIHFVCAGKGTLHIAGKTIPLSFGDVFFTFPSMPYCVESTEPFSYMYISFLGSRGNMIMENLGISSRNFFFSECQELYELWKKGINSNPELINLITESTLLYSFHFLGNKILPIKTNDKTSKNPALIIKKYIDDNFSQQNLSLEILSNELSYSPKYISTIFKKEFRVGISEYLNTLRIQNACTLMRQGFTSISDVSYQCGYSDSQYFSKVFKKKMGISPKDYINSI